MRRRNALDEIMAEHVRMPGAPGIIVERGWLYQWFKGQGYDPSARGYASMEWMTFGSCRPAVEEPLTLDDERDYMAKVLTGAKEAV